MQSVLPIVVLVSLWASVSASTARAAELQIIAPNIPPHFDKQGNGRIGDVIAAMKACGHTVSFTMVPFGRH